MEYPLYLSDPDSADGGQIVKFTLSSENGGEFLLPSHSSGSGPDFEIITSIKNLSSALRGCLQYHHPAAFRGTDTILMTLNDLESDLFGGRQSVSTELEVIVHQVSTISEVLSISELSFSESKRVPRHNCV